jgi:uncharacterized FAD-dependent dehydrogenase
MLQQVFQQLIPVFETVFAGLLAIALQRATAWMQAHVKDVAMQTALLKLETAVAAVVRETEQTVVADLKTNGAPMTPDQRAKVLADALATVKTHLGTAGLAEVAKAFSGSIDAILTSHIEAAVHDLRAGS